MSNKILFIEGIPGSGKTTRTHDIYKDLKCKGEKVEVYHECEINPLDLARYAILSKNEFEILFAEVDKREDKEKKERIRKKITTLAEVIDGRIYLSLRDMYLDEDVKDIGISLRNRDIYNGNFSFDVFRKEHIKRWKHFRKEVYCKDTIYLFDGILLQSPLFELIGFYDLTEKEIVQYINELLEILNVKESKLLYMHVNNVENVLKNACNKRKNEKEKWEQGFYKWIERSNYCMKRDYHGFEGMVSFLKERQCLEMKVIPLLDIEAAIYEREE